MHFSYVPQILPYLAPAAVTLVLFIYALRQKDVKGASPFGLTMLVATIWTAAYTLELGGADLFTKITAAKIEATVYPFAPVLWLIMVCRFTGYDAWLNKINTFLLFIIPLASIALVWTNDITGLWWPDTYIESSGLVPILVVAHGAGFWALIAYSYALNIIGEVLLIVSFKRRSALFHQQSLALFIGLALLFVPNFGFILGIPLFNRYDLTPAVMGISGLIIGWGIFRFKLFDIVPVARETIIENMPDGLIVLDAQNRLADMNPAARAIFKDIPGHAIGREAGEYFKDYPIITELCLDKPAQSREMVTGSGNEKNVYEVSCMELKDKKDRHTGLWVLFRNVTEKRDTQSRLIEQHKKLAASEERERLARDLHDNLGQIFGFINVQAQAVRRELSMAGVDIAGPKIERLAEAAQSAHQDMREYIQGIKDNRRAADLVDALKNEAEQFKKQTGTDIKLVIPDETPVYEIKPDTNTQIFNIIKETLNNIRKHAGATTVIIKIKTTKNGLQFIVKDDGNGFDVCAAGKKTPQGLGLGIMKDRAREIGGKIDIESAPGKGTKVILNIPAAEGASKQ